MSITYHDKPFKTISSAKGQEWCNLFNLQTLHNVPLDLVISHLVPMLVHHNTLGTVATICNQGKYLANDTSLWMQCCKARGWLKEFETKVEFRNALCGLNARETQRRCDFTVLR